MMRILLDTSVAIFVLPFLVTGEDQVREKGESLRLLGLAGSAEGRRSPRYSFAIAVPSVGELLHRVPDRKKRAALEMLEQMFEIVEYDREAALTAASMTKVLLRGSKRERQTVKVDAQIASCAVRWDFGAFCSYDDKQLKRFALVARDCLAGRPERFLVGEQEPLPLVVESARASAFGGGVAR